MKSFHFLWHLEFSIIACAQTENLSKTLQITCMTFVEGKALGDLVVKLLRVMREDDQLDMFHNNCLGHNMQDVWEPALPRLRNNNDYFKMHHNTRLDGLTSTSSRFDNAEASDLCRELCFECIENLVVRTKDRVDHKKLSLLPGVEIFVAHCFKGSHSLNLVEYEKTLGEPSIVHFSEDVDLFQLHFEFLNVHGRFTIDPDVKCLHDIFDFFHKTVENYYNYSFHSPNIFKLLRLVITHTATIATYECSFSLNKLSKTNIRSTTTDQRFNNLSILKHCKIKLRKNMI